MKTRVQSLNFISWDQNNDRPFKTFQIYIRIMLEIYLKIQLYFLSWLTDFYLIKIYTILDLLPFMESLAQSSVFPGLACTNSQVPFLMIWMKHKADTFLLSGTSRFRFFRIKDRKREGSWYGELFLCTKFVVDNCVYVLAFGHSILWELETFFKHRIQQSIWHIINKYFIINYHIFFSHATYKGDIVTILQLIILTFIKIGQFSQ